jgi:ABC-type polysaccharide/polyol phosphate export permease
MSSAATVSPTPAHGGLGIRATATAIGNEIHKGLLHAWGERLQILLELPLFVISLLLFALLVGRGHEIAAGHLDWRLDPTRVAPLLVGYAAFSFFYLQSAKLFWRLLGEIQVGTLEQVYLSPLPAWLVATAGRVLATVLETAVVVAVLSLVVFAVVPVHLVWQLQAVVPIGLIVASSAGYSLIEGGLTLIWKRVELIHDLVMGMMLFFGGALIPLDRLPGWMADIGRFSPLGQGVIALRAVLIDGRADFPLGGDGGLLWLIGTSAAYLLIGIATFTLGQSIARRQGSLGRY